MNRDKQIRKYLDGELNGEELEKFQNEINNSSEFKALVDSYRNTLNQFKKLRNDDIENPYFVNILPEFRERIEKKRYLRLRPSFAFGSVIIVIISILAIFIFNNKKEPSADGNIVTNEISSEALDSYLSNYSQDYTTLQLTEDVPVEYDSLLYNVIIDELQLSNNSDEYFVDITSNEFYSVIDELSTEEVEGIYNSLIAKKIID
jgi:hypothetical protein